MPMTPITPSNAVDISHIGTWGSQREFTSWRVHRGLKINVLARAGTLEHCLR
jgi:hypothetical protein